MYGYVIGANADDIFKTFSIGGDQDYRESQVDPFKKKKRFKPVCMFKGPIKTNPTGEATVSFNMPNYVGSVRVMVVAAKGDSYASEEKTVPVISDLIVQPTLPRALKPSDIFDIPVNVFATKDNIGEVTLDIKTEGPIEVIGERSIEHRFSTEDDELFYFRARVKEAVGPSKVTITCKSTSAESIFEADIPVSPSAARIYDQSETTVKPGQSVSIKIPKLGLDKTNNARLHVAPFPNMDFLHRVDYLIRYPYGCIEQTTSSVFPQLALKNLLNKEKRSDEIDDNIIAGINRLRSFQLSNGGFSYWPGDQEVSDWGTNYASQYLIEARSKGYVVPDGMYNNMINYLQRASRRPPTGKQHLMTRVNRCFILAMAKKAPINEMNLLKQNHFNEMNAVQKWQLVTAYYLAGAGDKVQNLVDNIGQEVEEYQEFGHTYGSSYRDMGIILRCLVLLERKEDAALLAKSIAAYLSDRRWYSTQTIGQMLLGIGNYFEYTGISAGQDITITGALTLPYGQIVDFEEHDKFSFYINEGYGESLQLSISSEQDIPVLYATLTANGVPLFDESEEKNNNLSLSIDWYDEDGENVDITTVEQGDTFYGVYQVSNTSVVPYIEEIALVQLLPSGWEIENLRLSNGLLPEWSNEKNLGNEDYLDIRDDRIMWFFDLDNTRSMDFVVKVNAITSGEYTLPGARCEAMYNNDFVATKEYQKVKVIKSND